MYHNSQSITFKQWTHDYQVFSLFIFIYSGKADVIELIKCIILVS